MVTLRNGLVPQCRDMDGKGEVGEEEQAAEKENQRSTAQHRWHGIDTKGKVQQQLR